MFDGDILVSYEYGKVGYLTIYGTSSLLLNAYFVIDIMLGFAKKVLLPRLIRYQLRSAFILKY